MSYLSRFRVSTILNVAVSVSFLVAAVAIIFVTTMHQRQETIHDAEQRAQLLANYSLAVHRFYRSDLKPFLFKEHTDKNEFEPVWMSTAYAMRHIAGYLGKSGDYYYKQCAINARSQVNEADAWQRSFIEELNRHPNLKSRTSIREIHGKPYLEVIRRGEVMERPCLRCHSTPGNAPAGLVKLYGEVNGFNRHEGETVSAICIRVPLGAAYSKANRLTWELAAMLLVILGALLYVQIRINRFLLVSPLAALTEKASLVANDEKHLGDEIHCTSGREFVDFAEAFNRMSRELRRRRDHLEERFFLFMENLPGIAFMKDRHGRHLYTNKLWQQAAFGGRPGNWQNKTDEELWPPEIAHRFMENDAKVFATGEVLQTEETDGSPRAWLSTKFPIRDESGTETILGGIAIDITEQKRLEQNLLEEKTFNDIIVNSMPGIFYLYSREGRFVRWNRNAEIVTGYSADELFQLQPLDFFVDDEKDAIVRKIEMVFNEGAASIEARLKTKEGKLIPYFLVASSIIMSGQRYLVGTGVDLTDRIRAEAELKASHERLKNLSAHLETVRENERKAIAREVHDELGQLLTAMRYDLVWLRKNLAIAHELPHWRHLDSLDAIVEEAVKSVQKVTAQLRPKLLDELGLKAAVEWQIANFTERSGIHCNALIREIPASLPAESSIAILRIIQEAFTNIMRHAEATEVLLSVVPMAENIVLTITDNGRGITHEELEASTSFGLMGMRERAAACGGTLEIAGAAGSGTTLRLIMPLKGDDGAQSIDC